MKSVLINQKIEIYSKYDPELVNVFRAAPGNRKWDAKKRCWVFDYMLENIEYLNQHGAGIPLPPGMKFSEIKHDFKVKPMAHQKRAFNLVMSNENFGIFHEQGTGKTFTAINIIMKYKPRRCLIICPKSVISSWVDQIPKYSDLDFQIFSGPKRKNGDFLIMNYDLLLKEKDKFLNSFDLIVFDESHYIANFKSRRTKAAIKMKAKKKVLLTGTPIIRSLENVFTQYKIIAPWVFGNYITNFRSMFFTDVGNQSFPIWVDKLGADKKVKKLLRTRADVIKSAECFDLPPQVFQKFEVEMKGDQAQAYKELKNDCVTYFKENRILANNALAQTVRLNQITSGSVGEIVFKNNCKLEALEELTELKKKIVIWCIFKNDVEAIMKKMKKFNPVEISGRVNRIEDRIENIKTFNNDPDCNCIVLQTAAGATGIELTASNYVIFYSQDYNYGNYVQAIKRTHRKGSEIHKSIVYINLICKKSINEHILKNQKKKESIANLVVSFFEEG